MVGLWAEYTKLMTIVVLTLVVWSGEVVGKEVSGLYDALIPVTDQSRQARERATRQGFAQVMTRLSGSSQVASSVAVQRALKDVSRFVNGYSYQQLPSAEVGEEPGLAVSVNFSSQVVNSFLRAEQLSIWPADRQPLLVWIVVDDLAAGRQLAGAEILPEAIQAAMEIAALRGLPVTLPVLDLQDRLTLRADDAWQFNEESLQAAARRYQAESWLVLRLFKTSQGQWRGSSWLSHSGSTRLENDSGESLSAFITSMMDKAVDRYSQPYVYIPRVTDRRLSLAFEGVNSYRDFKVLRDFLQKMEIVSDWELQSLSSDTLHMRVAVEGDPSVFFSALNRDNRFQPLSGEGRFRWVGMTK